MRHIAPLFIGAALLLAACGRNDAEDSRPAFGRAQADAPTATARYADGDRDGKVTRAEAQSDPMLSASFDRYDTDDNDELDRAEFARLEAHAAARRDGDESAADAEPSTQRPRSEFPHPRD